MWQCSCLRVINDVRPQIIKNVMDLVLVRWRGKQRSLCTYNFTLMRFFFLSIGVASLINICNLTKCYNITASWLFSWKKKPKGWWESGATSDDVLQVSRPGPRGEPRPNMKTRLASNQLPGATSCKRILQPFFFLKRVHFQNTETEMPAGVWLQWREESPEGELGGDGLTTAGAQDQSASLDNHTLTHTQVTQQRDRRGNKRCLYDLRHRQN